MFVPRLLLLLPSLSPLLVVTHHHTLASIRNANNDPLLPSAAPRATRYPAPFFIKIQRNFRGCSRASFETTPVPFVPRNLVKSFTLSTHDRDKACIRSYYLTVYIFAPTHTKANGVAAEAKLFVYAVEIEEASTGGASSYFFFSFF